MNTSPASATTLPPLPAGFELESSDTTPPTAKLAPRPGIWRVPPDGQPFTEGPLAGYALRPGGPGHYTPVPVAQSARAANISASELPALPAGFELEAPPQTGADVTFNDGRDAAIKTQQLKAPKDAGAVGFGKFLAQRFTQGALYMAKAIPAAVQFATSGADEDSFLSDLNRNARAVSDALTGTSEGIEERVDPYRRQQSQAPIFYKDEAGHVRFQIPNKEQFFGTLAGSLAPGRVIAGAGRGAAKMAGKAGLSKTPADMIGFGAANVAVVAPNVYEETFRQGKELGLTDEQADVAGKRAMQMFAPWLRLPAHAVKGEAREFTMFEHSRAQNAWRRKMEAQGFAVTVGKKIENVPALAGASQGFMRALDDILLPINGFEADKVRAQVHQLYLQTLPDLSIRKHFIHRKKTKGFNRDALRAFASQMFHGAHQLARLRHADLLQGELDAMREAIPHGADPNKAADLYNEMVKRHEWAMNPKGAVGEHGLVSRLRLVSGRHPRSGAAEHLTNAAGRVAGAGREVWLAAIVRRAAQGHARLFQGWFRY